MLTDGKPRGPCLMLQMLVPAASRNVRALCSSGTPAAVRYWNSRGWSWGLPPLPNALFFSTLIALNLSTSSQSFHNSIERYAKFFLVAGTLFPNPVQASIPHHTRPDIEAFHSISSLQF